MHSLSRSSRNNQRLTSDQINNNKRFILANIKNNKISLSDLLTTKETQNSNKVYQFLSRIRHHIFNVYSISNDQKPSYSDDKLLAIVIKLVKKHVNDRDQFKRKKADELNKESEKTGAQLITEDHLKAQSDQYLNRPILDESLVNDYYKEVYIHINNNTPIDIGDNPESDGLVTGHSIPKPPVLDIERANAIYQSSATDIHSSDDGNVNSASQEALGGSNQLSSGISAQLDINADDASNNGLGDSRQSELSMSSISDEHNDDINSTKAIVKDDAGSTEMGVVRNRSLSSSITSSPLLDASHHLDENNSKLNQFSTDFKDILEETLNHEKMIDKDDEFKNVLKTLLESVFNEKNFLEDWMDIIFYSLSILVRCGDISDFAPPFRSFIDRFQHDIERWKTVFSEKTPEDVFNHVFTTINFPFPLLVAEEQRLFDFYCRDDLRFPSILLDKQFLKTEDGDEMDVDPDADCTNVIKIKFTRLIHDYNELYKTATSDTPVSDCQPLSNNDSHSTSSNDRFVMDDGVNQEAAHVMASQSGKTITDDEQINQPYVPKLNIELADHQNDLRNEGINSQDDISDAAKSDGKPSSPLDLLAEAAGNVSKSPVTTSKYQSNVNNDHDSVNEETFEEIVDVPHTRGLSQTPKRKKAYSKQEVFSMQAHKNQNGVDFQKVKIDEIFSKLEFFDQKLADFKLNRPNNLHIYSKLTAIFREISKEWNEFRPSISAQLRSFPEFKEYRDKLNEIPIKIKKYTKDMARLKPQSAEIQKPKSVSSSSSSSALNATANNLETVRVVQLDSIVTSNALKRKPKASDFSRSVSSKVTSSSKGTSATTKKHSEDYTNKTLQSQNDVSSQKTKIDTLFSELQTIAVVWDTDISPKEKARHLTLIKRSWADINGNLSAQLQYDSIYKQRIDEIKDIIKNFEKTKNN